MRHGTKGESGYRSRLLDAAVRYNSNNISNRAMLLLLLLFARGWNPVENVYWELLELRISKRSCSAEFSDVEDDERPVALRMENTSRSAEFRDSEDEESEP